MHILYQVNSSRKKRQRTRKGRPLCTNSHYMEWSLGQGTAMKFRVEVSILLCLFLSGIECLPCVVVSLKRVLNTESNDWGWKRGGSKAKQRKIRQFPFSFPISWNESFRLNSTTKTLAWLIQRKRTQKFIRDDDGEKWQKSTNCKEAVIKCMHFSASF